MFLLHVLPAIAFALTAFAVSAPPAQAQSGDRCNNYANQMISFDQRARQMRCQNWTSHSNYNHHYNWCQNRPPASAQTALSACGNALSGMSICSLRKSGGKINIERLPSLHEFSHDRPCALHAGRLPEAGLRPQQSQQPLQLVRLENARAGGCG